jgi:hypothetical protein
MALLSWLSTLFVQLFCDLDPARTGKIGNYELATRFLKMKQIKEETGIGGAKTTQATPPPPPPPLPLPRFWVKKTITESVTNQEIAKFWRQKHIDEEDHLLAAIMAAARMRARNLSVRSYMTPIFRYLIKHSLADHIHST